MGRKVCLGVKSIEVFIVLYNLARFVLGVDNKFI